MGKGGSDEKGDPASGSRDDGEDGNARENSVDPHPEPMAHPMELLRHEDGSSRRRSCDVGLEARRGEHGIALHRV